MPARAPKLRARPRAWPRSRRVPRRSRRASRALAGSPPSPRRSWPWIPSSAPSSPSRPLASSRCRRSPTSCVSRCSRHACGRPPSGGADQRGRRTAATARSSSPRATTASPGSTSQQAAIRSPRSTTRRRSTPQRSRRTVALVATGSDDGTARLWPVDGRTADEHDARARRSGDGAGLRRRGRLLATGSRDRMARIWDVSTGDLLQTLRIRRR